MKNKRTENDNWLRGIKITDHFLSRYNQRVLGNKGIISNHTDLKKDLEKRLNQREKYAVDYFKYSAEVKFPMNKYLIVFKKRTFITIY